MEAFIYTLFYSLCVFSAEWSTCTSSGGVVRRGPRFLGSGGRSDKIDTDRLIWDQFVAAPWTRPAGMSRLWETCVKVGQAFLMVLPQCRRMILHLKAQRRKLTPHRRQQALI